MKGIGADWQQVNTEAERIASDVRIYCDNGEAVYIAHCFRF